MRDCLSVPQMAGRYGQNPFSTGRVRPGAIPYLFPDDTKRVELMRRIDRYQGCGQIVGPHGTGKSTLLQWLRRQIASRATPVVLISLQRDPGQGPVVAPDVCRWKPGTQLLIDGYQQLVWWRRRRFQLQCRRRQIRLIVTTHRPLGLATLVRTHVTPALAQTIVDRVLALPPSESGRGTGTIETGEFDLQRLRGSREIARRLARHRGDMRETLFSLYDAFEQWRRESGCDSTALGSGRSGQLDSTVSQTASVGCHGPTFQRPPTRRGRHD